MSKFGKWIEKGCCSFIGWNYNVLQQCGGASYRMLKIYTCAISIIMILWFAIGFVFSERYIDITSLLGKLFAGAIFALIVFFIERIIILHSGGKGIYAFRLVLSVSMAILGAFIFDQMIFRNDLEDAIRTEERIKLKQELEETISKTQTDLEKLKNETDVMLKEIQRNPYTKVKLKQKKIQIKDTVFDGGYQEEVIPNPLNEQVSANNELITSLMVEMNRLRNTNIDKLVYERIKNKKTGFLEELKASLRVIGESWISIVFYCILFVVLLCLELFVVSLKLFKSRKCEYDLIIEHQLEVKEIQLKNAMRKIKEKYITNTYEDKE